MNELFSWCRKKMTKENMIVLALSGVLLMVVAIPTGKEKNKTDESKSVQLDTQTVTMDSESNSAQQEAMEEKLAQFLSRMEGAGRVEVLITYASTEEQVIEKETPSVTNSQTSENDAGGTSRVISEFSRQENTVYQTGRDGSKTPYVTHTLSAKVEEGDVFYLHVLDEVLAYKVDQIKVVLPEETQDIGIVEGKDYCTLVTCTPYAINTHRLLVRGERTEYIPPEELAEQNAVHEVQSQTITKRIVDVWPWLVVSLLIVAGVEGSIFLLIVKRQRSYGDVREKRKKGKRSSRSCNKTRRRK